MSEEELNVDLSEDTADKTESTPDVDDAVEAKPETRKHKVKVDGEEREISDEDLLKDYQLRESSYYGS